MNRNLAMRRLWWKELQQLWPLVGLLFLMGLILQVLAVLLPGMQEWRRSAALLGMPGLFAAGAGALLVGQDKELRTLDWLRSLPIAAADLARTKLLVGLLGLVIVWLASLLLAAVTGSLGSLPAGQNGEYLYPLHSVFLLLVGFATAWSFRSSLISLLVVVPAACLPLLAATLHYWLVVADRSLRFVEPQPGTTAIYLTLFSVLALWLGWKAALSYLGPAKAPGNWRPSSAQLPTGLGMFRYPRTSPVPALLWQYSAQNRAALIGLGLLLSACVLSMLAGPASNGQSLGFFFLAGLLGISWLGVLVFQSDVQQQRVMFLADRGVPPWLTWLTRQSIPFAILTLFLLMFILIGSVFSEQVGVGLGTAGLAIVSSCALGVYVASQWLGQMLRSPILAAIVTPLAAAGAVAFNIYAISELGASRWSVGLAMIVPFVATFSMTRGWMDHRLGWRYWLGHAAMLIVAIALPLTGFVTYAATYPTLSTQAKQELQSIVSESPKVAFAAMLPTPSVKSVEAEDGNQPASLSQAEYRDAYFASLGQLMAENLGGVPDVRVALTCIGDALLSRMGEHETMDGSARSIDAVKHYRESTGLVVQLHERLRADGRLCSQDYADVCEMLLLEELKAVSAKQRMGDGLYSQVVRVLVDRPARQLARRRAIALSWSAVENYELGGYSLGPTHDGRVTTRDVWESSRKAGLVSELLLKTLDASGDELTQLRSTICQVMGVANANSARDAAYLSRSPDGQPQLLYGELQSYNLIPGVYWNGAWEEVAAKLAGQE